MTELIGGKTLKEIWDMPRSESIIHMKQHVHPLWGEQKRDKEPKDKLFDVEVEWSRHESGTKTYEVVAEDEEEAKSIARDKFSDEAEWEDEIEFINVEEVK